MFDHLDDPQPPAVGVAARLAVESRRVRLARRRRIAYTTAASVTLAAAGTGIALGATTGRGSAVRIQTGPPTSLTVPATTTVVPTVRTIHRPLRVSMPPTTYSPSPSVPLSCGQLNPVGRSGPVTATAANGDFEAVLSGTLDMSAPGGPLFKQGRLVVSMLGRPLVDEAVQAPSNEKYGFKPSQVSVVDLTGSPFGANYPTSAIAPLCLARFAGAADPTALLGFYSGAAHCCFALRAISIASGGPSSSEDLELGNWWGTVETNDGRVIVVTADNRFAYAFSSFAGSGMPLMVYEVSGGGFVVTSRNYADLLTADAAKWWQQINNPQNQGPGGGILGVVAPWVADECELGQSGYAWAWVNKLNAEGKLNGPFKPTGSAYVAALRTFLGKTGYC